MGAPNSRERKGLSRKEIARINKKRFNDWPLNQGQLATNVTTFTAGFYPARLAAAKNSKETIIMLKLTINEGEPLKVGDAYITIFQKRGTKRYNIGVSAPCDIPIVRHGVRATEKTREKGEE